MNNFMTSNRGAFGALAVLGGYFVFRNRFAIQRRLESMGIKTPLLRGSVEEAARSVASRAVGKMENGATIAENLINRRSSTG